MTSKKFEETFEEIVEIMKITLLKKGHDYANADAMSNFKKIGLVTDQTPEKVILTLAASKISRLSNLFTNGVIPTNESVKDSIIDLACYGVLLFAMNAETIALKQQKLP